jgi:hypothetical protein
MNNDDRTLLIEFYKENQKFIDKGLFTVSSVSLPLLLGFPQKLTYESGWIARCLLIALQERHTIY